MVLSYDFNEMAQNKESPKDIAWKPLRSQSFTMSFFFFTSLIDVFVFYIAIICTYRAYIAGGDTCHNSHSS